MKNGNNKVTILKWQWQNNIKNKEMTIKNDNKKWQNDKKRQNDNNRITTTE